ncbi:MAG: ester cyclase [Dehalococcoidales bacterium]|nr:ester cyclase [Dehalococcoidales bacterium]
MTDTSNGKIVERFINSVFINHDFRSLDEIMRDDYIQHNADVAQGKAGFLEFFKKTFKAMPDFKYTVNKIVAEGDIVMAWCTTSGTHNGGDWLGIPPSGNRLEFDCVDIFRIQDGKIAEHWDVADSLKLFRQLGHTDRLKGKA